MFPDSGNFSSRWLMTWVFCDCKVLVAKAMKIMSAAKRKGLSAKRLLEPNDLHSVFCILCSAYCVLHTVKVLRLESGILNLAS